jgi:retinol dehydrogenase 14
VARGAGPEAPPDAPADAPRPPGPTYVVTGASGGIGRATARGIARPDATLVLVARRRPELEVTAEAIRAASPGARACLHPADLSRTAEVRRVAAEILAEHPRIDAAVQNAGGWFHGREVTPDGNERTLALNVLAPLLLTELLRPGLAAARPSRVVMVASEAHRGHHLDLDDLDARPPYHGYRTYSRSKLALLGVTEVLAERLRRDGIDVNALHPGFIASGFGHNNPGAAGRAIRVLEWIGGRSPARGARLPILLATDPTLTGVTGRYFWRHRSVAIAEDRVDPALARQLFALLAARVGIDAGRDAAS